MNPHTLDFILIVAASFFVLTDIILALCLRCVLPGYVIDVNSYYAGGYELPFPAAAAKCHCLHKVFPNGTNFNIIFDKDPKPKPIQELPEPIQKPPESTERQPETEILPAYIEERFARNPWLLSIHVKNDSEWNFQCIGLILSKKTLIASRTCNISDYSLDKLLIRSQSPYYNKLGQLHNISSLDLPRKTTHLFIDVEPPFQNKLVPNPGFTFEWERLVHWTYATELIWEKSTEDEPFTERIWTTLNPPSNLTKKVCRFYSRSLRIKMLLTNCNHVLRLRMEDYDVCSHYKAYALKNTSFVLPECKEPPEKQPETEILPPEIQARFDRNPWIVSVHAKNNSKWIFQCPALISSDAVVITSVSCTCNETDSYTPRSCNTLYYSKNDLRVRSNSPYYNKLGEIHDVTHISRYPDIDGIVVLNVRPSFQSKLIPIPQPKVNPWVTGWEYATEIHWHNSTEDQPFTERIWTTINLPSNMTKGVCPTYKKTYHLAIVLTNCMTTLAFKMSENKFCYNEDAYRLEEPAFIMPEC